MRLRNRQIPQAGPQERESRPGPVGSGSPVVSGGGAVSQSSAQYSTVADQHLNQLHPSGDLPAKATIKHNTISYPSSPISSTHSLFQSYSSSPTSFQNSSTSSSSSTSPMSVSVEQEPKATKVVPTAGTTKRTRKHWTNEMNRFIWRTYLEIVLETNSKKYLEQLHLHFNEKFPHMNVTRQRVGHQRRSIIKNKLLSLKELDKIKQEVIFKQQTSTQSRTQYPHTQYSQTNIPHAKINNQPTIMTTQSSFNNSILTSMRPEKTKLGKSRQRMYWTDIVNRALLKCYYKVTNNESNVSAYRPLLHKEFTELYPELHFITEQRLSDQVRVIKRNNRISPEEREQLKLQQSNENTTSPTTIETLQTGHTLTPIQVHTPTSLHAEGTCINIQTLNTEHVTPTRRIRLSSDIILNEITNQTNLNCLTQSPIANISQEEQTLLHKPKTPKSLRKSDITAQEIERHFKDTLEQFKNTDPVSRPYVPKQKTSRRLSWILHEINTKILPKYLSLDIDYTTLQSLIYAAAYTTAISNGSKIETRQNRQTGSKPSWQIRLETKIGKLRADIGQLSHYIAGCRSRRLITAVENIKNRYKRHAQYENSNTELTQFLDTLKQKLNVKASRLARYTTCSKRKLQNAHFKSNEKNFYRSLSHNQEQIGNPSIVTPSVESMQKYWASILGKPVRHNETAEWIDKIKQKTNHQEMSFELISVDTFKSVIEKLHNWKSPGSDHIHNFWYKKFTSTHPYIHNYINQFIQSPHTMPQYITHGKTYLLPKDMNDTCNPAKYRPITCLQTIYKIMTACISKTIYSFLEANNILSEQQKGCRILSQGCKEQLISIFMYYYMSSIIIYQESSVHFKNNQSKPI